MRINNTGNRSETYCIQNIIDDKKVQRSIIQNLSLDDGVGYKKFVAGNPMTDHTSAKGFS